jgi:hypothetical protein
MGVHAVVHSFGFFFVEASALAFGCLVIEKLYSFASVLGVFFTLVHFFVFNLCLRELLEYR